MPENHSNYPNGWANGVTVKNMPVLNTYSNNVFWVCSTTGSDSYKGTFRRPFATLDYAVGRCTANRGDVIMVKANHAESITADSGVDIDVAGVSVIGLGAGEDRPTFTFTTAATADFKLAANNVTVRNLLFKAGIDALTGPIEISADDCHLIDCEYRDDDTSNYETVDVVVTASTPLRMVIDGFVFHHDGGSGGTQNQSVIQLNGADHAVIRNCWLVADSGTGVIEDATTSDCILIDNCRIESSNATPKPGIAATATTTGTVSNTYIRIASGSTYVTANTDLQYFECYGTGTDATAGEKIGTIIAGDLEAKIDVIDGYHDVPVADTSTNTVMRDVIGNKTDAAVSVVGTTNSILALAKGIVNEITVAVADTSTNAFMNEVVGNKTDAAKNAVGTTNSIMALVKGILNEVTVATADTSDNAFVNDIVGNKTDAAKNAVGTTNSIMALVKGILNEVTVATADTSDNAFINDIVGNKTDAAVNAVGTTNSIMALVKGLVNEVTVATANTSDNAFINDVIGNKTDATRTGAVGTTASMVKYLKQLVTADDGFDALQSRYIEVHADMTSATWGTTANSHEILTVTGPCRVRLLARCSDSLVANVACLIQLGNETSTTAYIADTTASMIDTSEFWVSSTTASNVAYVPFSSIIDTVVNGLDLGYDLSGHADGCTGGGIVFHMWWQPLDAAATCVAGAGGTL